MLGKSIDERPTIVDTRVEYGHWEGDGIVGKGHKGHLVTLVERQSGMGMLFNVVDREQNKIVDQDMIRIYNYINTMPRKRFGYKTPLDLWNENINAIMSV